MSGQPAAALRVEHRDDGVAVVTMDQRGAAVNTLKQELADEFQEILEQQEHRPNLTALVFVSGKQNSFIVGADIEMLARVESAVDASALSRVMQNLQARLAMLPVPTVCAIHGDCLGGGLELALTFDYRIASDDDATRFGLPEVKLGLLPGGGGTQRLPRLIGVRPALDMMLTGRGVRADEALGFGLVDELVPKNELLDAAVRRARTFGARNREGERVSIRRPVDFPFSKAGLSHYFLARTAPGRHLLFSRADKSVRAKTRGNYPAPERILEVVRTGLERGMPAGLAAETKAFGELAVSPEARQLVGIFLATNALKKDTGVDDPNVRPRELGKVGVLGAGFMGAGIAFVTAYRAGLSVRLKDRDMESAERGRASARRLLDKRVSRGRLSAAQRDQVMERIRAGVDLKDFEDAGVVIEAVFEDLDLKHRMVRDVETLHRRDIIFATNTSSIPISEIARAAQRPESVIGMHYFSPVEKMPLLEVVVTDRTADEVIVTCVELGKRQGKTVIVVNDGPGFYTSRILAPFMNEAAWILSERVRIEDIDRALETFGFPVGPIMLLDEVGIDVAEKVGAILSGAFGERMSPPPGLRALRKDDRMGRKNRRGFYWYGEGDKRHKGVDTSVYDAL
ncbi:MAG: 3-hydroxyacyl-CoA dehydrogenase NAD-binding domain-containing protein, partial [Gammaproteobacteria bacterium]|nr:3-hydroxyacyl-CoA dehydrogenase NAD-binding domain-containing protein [Gammaproteobacteria bacterium]